MTLMMGCLLAALIAKLVCAGLVPMQIIGTIMAQETLWLFMPLDASVDPPLTVSLWIDWVSVSGCFPHNLLSNPVLTLPAE